MFGIGNSAVQAAQVAQLGTALVALRLGRAARLPSGCVELVFSAAGQARRAPYSRKGRDESAYAYHPGPYETAFAPFAAAPEIGLRLRYLADASDPRVAQQRFDLFLFSEAGDALAIDALHGAVAAAVRDALAQGTLDLPACTTLDEWHAFRAGLNELLYTRFGLTVDDCVPVDLADAVDYAQVLRARQADMPGAQVRAGAGEAVLASESQASGADAHVAADEPVFTFDEVHGAAPDVPVAAAAAPSLGCGPAAADAHALRRLFLELPAWSAGVRALDLPAGQLLFAARREYPCRQRLRACRSTAFPASVQPPFAAYRPHHRRRPRWR
ncbi:hypothetical protein [Pseudoduganella ginsengisoli]|uniref:Uncharacterized protein n=1 Tax=Pseudoduganella ginsengisoli TaxID=1462440 RepID=A0A6L6Q9N6_9BURK|nr:hypothetical protein [Pseudoduganella ginsengisoli]MTW06340.1 hypothetical protein [Pseudoduganella ginsengisoli]